MTAAPAVESRPPYLQPFALLGLVGVLFTVIGGLEILTQIFPLSLGNPEWEFGTYSSVMDSMPLLLMGLGFLGVFAIVGGHKVLGRVLAIVLFGLALVVIAFAFLYLTNVPQALRINPRSSIQTGIKKAISKASIQTAVFPVALLWLGAVVLRNSKREPHRDRR
ncbi:MAG TPA: hypothetical protein VGP80_05415 [Gemmatimonadales bacterium]|jgi:hypothetical protein|nr:hypothetical protein [Gemmatimonadales bacterium]